MTEQISAGRPITYASLERIKGNLVKVRVLNRRRTPITRTGELRYLGRTNVVIIVDSGNAYHIPRASIISVEVLLP